MSVRREKIGLITWICEGLSVIKTKLGDPKFKPGWRKYQYSVKSAAGKNAVVHYNKHEYTGIMKDFKFK